MLQLLQPVSHHVSANDQRTWVRFDGSGCGSPLFALISEMRRHVSWCCRLQHVCHTCLCCLPARRLWRQKLIYFLSHMRKRKAEQSSYWYTSLSFNQFCILDNAGQATFCPLLERFFSAQVYYTVEKTPFKIKVCKLGNAENLGWNWVNESIDWHDWQVTGKWKEKWVEKQRNKKMLPHRCNGAWCKYAIIIQRCFVHVWLWFCIKIITITDLDRGFIVRSQKAGTSVTKIPQRAILLRKERSKWSDLHSGLWERHQEIRVEHCGPQHTFHHCAFVQDVEGQLFLRYLRTSVQDMITLRACTFSQHLHTDEQHSWVAHIAHTKN